MSEAQASPAEPGIVVSNEQPQAEAPVQKYKVKVDGAEQEVTLDNLLKGYQLESSSRKRMEEAAQLRKQTEQERWNFQQSMAKAKQDPEWALKQLGIDDVSNWAYQKALKDLERKLESEEERGNRESREELEELRKWRAEQQKTAQERELQTAIQREATTVENEVTSILAQHKWSSKPALLLRVAEIMHASLSRKGAPLSATQAFEMMRKSYPQELNDYLDAVPDEELPQLFPKYVERMKKYSLSQQRKSVPNIATAQAGARPAVTQGNSEGGTWKDIIAKRYNIKT
jgi:hypothetical protein